MKNNTIYVYYEENGEIKSTIYGIYKSYDEAYTDLLFLHDILEETNEVDNYVFSLNMPEKMQDAFIKHVIKSNKKLAIII